MIVENEMIMGLFNKTFSPRKIVDVVKRENLAAIDAEMDECVDNIRQYQSKITALDTAKINTRDKTQMQEKFNESITYFVRRRDSLFIAKSYIHRFANALESEL